MQDSLLTSKKFLVIATICVVVVSVLVVSIQVVRSNRMRVATSPTTPSPSLMKEGSANATGDPSTSFHSAQDDAIKIVHVPLPDEVRGIYWTAFTTATKRADELMVYMKKTGLNTVVIDLKMDNGQIAFTPNDPFLAQYAMKKPAIRDLDALLEKLANDHIYRIARIAVMRDSAFASVQTTSALRSKNSLPLVRGGSGWGLWRDKTGSMWSDPASLDVAMYALVLAHEAYARGFDEVQFDYVRFASDGSISNIMFPYYNGKDLKVDVMNRFFAAVGGSLQADHIPVSFDVFGLTCMTNDGLGIGQRLDGVLASGDFVSPMVYPSHYANGFQGFANPAVHPYDVIKISLDRAVELLSLPVVLDASTANTTSATPPSDSLLRKEGRDEKRMIQKRFRPWIQDFDIGAVYTGPMIEAEIKAVRDAGASGFLIWNARNVYEPAEYLKK